jgi:acyl-CoA thioester hydrolase
MVFPAPVISSLQTVEDQWTDYNGHLNMAYYNVLFDRSVDEVMSMMGLGPAYAKAAGCSMFTLEAHITYLQEVKAGDRVAISVQLLDFDSKRLHFVQSMYHHGDNFLSSVSENMLMHVDLKARKSCPFPSHISAKATAMHEAHKLLPVPPQVGHQIKIPRR